MPNNNHGGGSKEGDMDQYAAYKKPQSTHSAPANKSVEKILLEWEQAHFPLDKSTKEKETFVEEIISRYDTFVGELEEKEPGKRFVEAWKAFKIYMDEPTNQLDLIVENADGGKKAISVKDSFVLTCLAAQGGSKDGKNVYSSRQSSKKEIQQRLKVLLEEISRLYKNKFMCHTGVRHSLVGTLDKVYPGFTLVADRLTFIQAHLGERLKQILNAITDPEKKRKIYIAWYKNREMPEAFVKLMAGVQQGVLKIYLTAQCQKAGVLDQKSQELIDGMISVESLQEQPEVPTGSNTQLQELRSFYHPRTSHSRLLSRAKSVVDTWIVESWSPEHSYFLRDYLLINQTSLLLDDHQYGLQVWGQAQLKAEELEGIARICKQWLDAATNTRKQLSDSSQEKLIHFKKTVAVYKKDGQVGLIENYFANYFRSQRLADKGKISRLLLDSSFKKKALLSDGLMQKWLACVSDGKVELTPYKINRIFLTALLKDNKNWGEGYSSLLKSTLDFVRSCFNQEGSQRVSSLRQSSYPDRLLSQIDYLLSPTGEIPESAPFCVPYIKWRLGSYCDWSREMNISIEDLLGRQASVECLAGLKAAKELFAAASRGDHVVVEELLQRLSDLSYKGASNGSTALIIAVENGHIEVVKLLLANGAKVNERSNQGFTALIFASKKGCVETVKLLLSKGANVDEVNRLGETALILAAENGHTEVVESLLKARASVDEKTNEGKDTALIVAAGSGHAQVVQLLLKAQASVNQKRTWGISALIQASWKGVGAAVDLLLNAKANVDEEAHEGVTSLICAAKDGHVDVVKRLLNAKANITKKLHNHGYTALLVAVSQGHAGVVELLLKAKGNVDEQPDGSDMTLLMRVTRKKDAAIMALLLQAKANVDHKAKNGFTSLILASKDVYVEGVRLLLSYGANVDVRTSRGKTPLMMAASKSGNGEVVEILMKASSRVSSVKNSQEKVKMRIAAGDGNKGVTTVFTETQSQVTQSGGGSKEPADSLATVSVFLAQAGNVQNKKKRKAGPRQRSKANAREGSDANRSQGC